MTATAKPSTAKAAASNAVRGFACTEVGRLCASPGTPSVEIDRAHAVQSASSPVDDADTIEQVWQAYRRCPTDRLLNRLVNYYMNGHVRRIAERLHARLPAAVDLDDLMQEGYVGLVRCIERFDESQNTKFETYSSRRIEGAMCDYLRRLDVIPRLARTRQRELDRMLARFRAMYGRSPGEEELLELLGGSKSRYQSLLAASRVPAMVNYNSTGSSSSSSTASEDGCEDGDAMGSLEDRRGSSFGPNGSRPLRWAEREDLRRWISRGLSQRERLIITLYYYEDMTMSEVGETLGISESRVSQCLGDIIKAMRSRFQNTGADREFV